MRIFILCGGSGTRLWPASREGRPKQFLALLGDESLIIQTARRALAVEPLSLSILTNPSQAPLAREALDAADIDACITIEPAQRNTGPAIAYAAALVAQDGDEPLAFLPADHYVPDTAAFSACLKKAADVAARQNALVVVGRPPDRPETGYGYIERGEPLEDGAYQAARFVEKPDAATALRYLESGRYWWNTGLVIAKPSVILDEIRALAPEIAGAVLETAGHGADYARSPNLSFDYAVLEKSSRVVMLEATFGWSDVGTWLNWSEHASVDDHGNALRAGSKIHALNARNNAVWAEKPVALHDVDDLVIVDTPDVLYVTRRESAPSTGEMRKAAGKVEPGLL